jgi:methylamine dehydrogenase heavy chain
MRSGVWVALCGLCLGVGATAAVPPPLKPEHLEVARLPAPSPHWAYLFDFSFNNETDGRVYLYDGDAGRMLGQFEVGYYPNLAISPDGRTSAVATTYWSRGGHGQRTEVLEWVDNTSLTVRGEVVLPLNRAQVGAVTPYNLSYSPDGRFVYSTSLTPASSVVVVDVAGNRIAGEVDTDGCVQAIPLAPYGFAALCESGRLLSIHLDAQGHETGRSLSAPFFDIDKDPVFVQSVPNETGAYYVSFHGEVHAVDVTGPEPRFAPTWSLLDAKDRAAHWRPGGQQMIAYAPGASRLYVAMHQGGEGTHKINGTEVWVYDTKTHRRLARWPIDVAHLGGAIALLATQDAEPLLYVATENSALLVLDAKSGVQKHVEAKMGQTLWFMMNSRP